MTASGFSCFTRGPASSGTSAYYDGDAKGTSSELTVDGFVVKPVERETLAREVVRVAQRR